MASELSGLLKAGSLDRRIQILELTYVKVRGEAREGYTQILSLKANKSEEGGTEEEAGGTVVAFGTVQWLVRYQSQFSVLGKKNTTLKLLEMTSDPVYLRDNDDQILYDLSGNPLLSLEQSPNIGYDILHIAEVGRKVGHLITAQRWQ